MNVISRYMKTVYTKLILQYHTSGYWRDIGAFRKDMIQNYGCISIKQTKYKASLFYVWEIQVIGHRYIYRYDTLKKEIKIMG